MIIDYKNINIGQLIRLRVKENNIELSRICNYMKCTVDEINEMYMQENLCAHTLLRWSKLLKYDFFRVYSHHLILFSPPAGNNRQQRTSQLPQFRKHIYTREIIDFILELINTGRKTKIQIIEEYNIPKTTLYKWIHKYNN